MARGGGGGGGGTAATATAAAGGTTKTTLQFGPGSSVGAPSQRLDQLQGMGPGGMILPGSSSYNVRRSITMVVAIAAAVCPCIYIILFLLLDIADLHRTTSPASTQSTTSFFDCTTTTQASVENQQIPATTTTTIIRNNHAQNNILQEEAASAAAASQEATVSTLVSTDLHNIAASTDKISTSGASSSESSSTVNLSRIVFGIGAAAKNWSKRKEYIKLWWNSASRNHKKLRGFVWLDEELKAENTTTTTKNKTSSSSDSSSFSLPPFRISEDVSDRSRFNWRDIRKNPGVRLSRIVAETFRTLVAEAEASEASSEGFGSEDDSHDSEKKALGVDWFVIGDDDTFFFPENVAKVLSKYDASGMVYVGSSSEAQRPNLFFSYNMAFGGGGFAVSFPLAKALAQMQDECNFRYGRMLGSDDRIWACMSELGVPLTKNPGFHQMDIRGDAFGILAAHPVTPILSIHHLDSISPIFPNMNQVQALQKLTEATKVESGSVMQQSICYDENLKWSFSVSWGYVVHVHYGFIKPHEMEVPIQTFATLYGKWPNSDFSINLRGYPKDHCTHPTRYYVESVQGPLENSNNSRGLLESIYSKGDHEKRARADCNQPFMGVLNSINRIRVVKEPIREDWYQAPRRSCCKIKSWDKEEIDIYLGTCQEGEFLVSKH